MATLNIEYLILKKDPNAMNDKDLFSPELLKELEELRQNGIEPYPLSDYHLRESAANIKNNFEQFEGKTVTVAGRLITKRLHGKAGFATILSNGEKLQIYYRKDSMPEEVFERVKKLINVGDIIGLSGIVFKTHTEEITVEVQHAELLSKALSPLPEKWHGIENVEVRYRQRYLDLLMHEDVRAVFKKRAKILKAVRDALLNEAYTEVDTPILQDIYGGALAKPFTTFHNALDQDLFLRIAPELYLKRLIIGGLEKVFEMGKAFRNEGISLNHNPEFTIMELYEAYGNYHTMMDICEKIFDAICTFANEGDEIEFKGHKINCRPPFAKLSLEEAFTKYASVDIHQLNDLEYARAYLKKEGIRMDKPISWASVVDEVLKKKVEPHLIQPTFIYDYPLPLSPLAKKKSPDSQWVERFQLVVGGLEVGNAFTELNDPVDQYERFAGQDEARQKGDLEAHTFDRSYIEAMKFGLPPTGGLGLGIDRIVMLFTGQESIREVLLFPQLRKRDS